MIIDNAIYQDGVRVATPVSLEETTELKDSLRGMAWIGLYRPSAEEFSAVAEEFGHVLVEVEQERHATELLWQGGNVEEVRHRGNLHEVVSAPMMLAREAPGGHRGECHVLGEVTGESGEEAVQREANDPLRAIGLVRGLARLAQREDVDLVAGIGQGVALAADAGVARIDRVDNDRHPPRTVSHLGLSR